jgi:ElaB/YqjD/DUF883 family membrane-anchored ribosome-binding protein
MNFHFLTVLLSGFVLAVAFQLLLMNLSFAAGLQLLRPVTDPDAARAPRESAPAPGSFRRTALKISSGVGIWILAASCIALFSASYLAVNLLGTGTAALGAICGLVIWGLCYLFLLSFETAAAGSLAGSLFRFVRAGYQSVHDTAAGIFTGSDEKKAAQTAARVTRAVKEELFGSADTKKALQQLRDVFQPREGLRPGQVAEEAGRFREKLESYLRSAQIGALKPEEIEKDLASLLSDPKAGMQSLKERLSGIDETTVATLISERTDISKEQAQKVVNRIAHFIDDVKHQGEAAGRSAADQLRSTLHASGKPELELDAALEDLREFAHNPKESFESLTGRLRSLDRDALRSMLISRGIAPEKVDQAVQRFETSRRQILERVESVQHEVARRMEEMKYEARRAADDTRKVAAAAAWWFFATALASGGAAALGGFYAFAK